MGKDYTTDDLEEWGIHDPNKYKKVQLVDLVKLFVEEYDYTKLSKRVDSNPYYCFMFIHIEIKREQLKKSFKVQFVYEIHAQYAKAFQEYLRNRVRVKKSYRFKKIRLEHVRYIQAMMKNLVKRNYTIAQKTALLNE